METLFTAKFLRIGLRRVSYFLPSGGVAIDSARPSFPLVGSGLTRVARAAPGSRDPKTEVSCFITNTTVLLFIMDISIVYS